MGMESDDLDSDTPDMEMESDELDSDTSNLITFSVDIPALKRMVYFAWVKPIDKSGPAGAKLAAVVPRSSWSSYVRSPAGLSARTNPSSYTGSSTMYLLGPFP